MDVDGPRVAVEVLAPDKAEQALSVQDQALVAHEGSEEVELLGAQRDRFLGDRHLASQRVEADVADLEDGLGSDGALAAPEDGLDAGDQLSRVEGLRDVVVGADLEADDLVDVVVAGGEDDDGNVGCLAQLFADGEAVHLRHHYVEDDQVGVDGARLLQRLFAVVRLFHPEALVAEIEPGKLNNVFLVVDNKDGVGHVWRRVVTLYAHDTTPQHHHRRRPAPQL